MCSRYIILYFAFCRFRPESRLLASHLQSISLFETSGASTLFTVEWCTRIVVLIIFGPVRITNFKTTPSGVMHFTLSGPVEGYLFYFLAFLISCISYEACNRKSRIQFHTLRGIYLAIGRKPTNFHCERPRGTDAALCFRHGRYSFYHVHSFQLLVTVETLFRLMYLRSAQIRAHQCSCCH